MEPEKIETFASVNDEKVTLTNEDLREPHDEFDDSRDIGSAGYVLNDGTPVKFWYWSESDLRFLDVCVEKEHIPQITTADEYQAYLYTNGFAAKEPKGWKNVGAMDCGTDFRLQFYCEDD